MSALMARVVIIGAGFAGLAAARALDDRHEVTLVDRSRCFEFLPNIHEIVSGLKTRGVVRIDRQRIAKQQDQTFVEDDVVTLDGATRTAVLGGSRLPYDAVILAAGSVPRTRRADHAHAFRSADDAERVRLGLVSLAERRASRAWITIVGGGATGVEVLGEMLRRHRKRAHMRFRLVEGGERLVRGWPRVVHRRVKKLAERHDVEVHLGMAVEHVGPSSIRLASGVELPSDLTVWTAGIETPPIVASAGMTPRPGGFAPVDDTLASPALPGVFIAGDAASFPRRVPKQAAEALAMGERAARNAQRWLAGRALKRFRRTKGVRLLTFGDLDCFLVLDDDTVFEGAALAVGRELVFERTMAELEPIGRAAAKHISKRFRAALRQLPCFDVSDPFEIVERTRELRVHPP
jgi:NADH dehydrogenase